MLLDVGGVCTENLDPHIMVMNALAPDQSDQTFGKAILPGRPVR